MMTEMDGPQAHAVANVIHALRDDWDTQGIRAALFTARARGTAFEVAHAALYAAADPTNRTPAVIPLAGAHWARAKASSTAAGGDNMPGRERCPEHPSERAHNCRIHQSERIGVTPTTEPTAAQTTSRGLTSQRIAEIFENEGVAR